MWGSMGGLCRAASCMCRAESSVGRHARQQAGDLLFCWPCMWLCSRLMTCHSVLGAGLIYCTCAGPLPRLDLTDICCLQVQPCPGSLCGDVQVGLCAEDDL